MFTTAQLIVSLVIGKTGHPATDHAMEVVSTEQGKLKPLQEMEASFAKEMQKKFKSVIPSHVQLLANGMIGMNGSNAVNHVEVESLREPVTSNNMPNLVDKTVLEMLSKTKNATNKIVQPTVHGIHGVNGELAQSHVEEEDKKESEALTLPQLSEVDNVKVQQANLEFVTTIHVQETAFGKNLDTGEAVANLAEVENKQEQEKSDKKPLMVE